MARAPEASRGRANRPRTLDTRTGLGYRGSVVILLGRSLPEGALAEIDAIVPGARVVSEADLAADPSLTGRIEVCYAHLPSGSWASATSLAWFQIDGNSRRSSGAPGMVV